MHKTPCLSNFAPRILQSLRNVRPIGNHRLRYVSSASSDKPSRAERVDSPGAQRRLRKAPVRIGVALAVAFAGWAAFESSEPTRHTVLAVQRSLRIAEAVLLDVIDYKWTMSQNYESAKEKDAAYSKCHKRSAHRLLLQLQANGGIFVKLGQHVSSVNLLPIEWTSTMKALQDQCFPTPFEDVKALFEHDVGQSIDEIYYDFDPQPIGVASLAQVHIAYDRETGKKVAVKIQHPHLEEFAQIDMRTTTFALSWVKRLFPEFEFSWLGEEMQTNLPLEMNFVHEAENTRRAEANFADVKRTSVYFPYVMRATKRTLVMEYIDGARVDDLKYLADHNIDRNQVSQELSRIFSRMVYIHGFFHADPHAGNLLIRPKPPGSRSPYNFEIALLDHGLYFDIDDDLRVNYSHLWLSLIAPGREANRRKYAALVGNIGPELYPVFETAITGRQGMDGTWDDSNGSKGTRRASNMLEMTAQSDGELERIRDAVFNQEGLILSLFDLLRRVPRRVLMLFKMNDLTRNLDTELKTTHSRSRVFIIVARFCSLAVWRDDCRRFFTECRDGGLRIYLIIGLAHNFWSYHYVDDGLRIVELVMDFQARLVKMRAWWRGWRKYGFSGAHASAAGLEVA